MRNESHRFKFKIGDLIKLKKEYYDACEEDILHSEKEVGLILKHNVNVYIEYEIMWMSNKKTYIWTSPQRYIDKKYEKT